LCGNQDSDLLQSLAQDFTYIQYLKGFPTNILKFLRVCEYESKQI
jgi:hypothetical protein